MATSESLLGCIDLALTTKGKLPESIHKAAAEGRKDLIIAALQQHIDQLKGVREEIKEQHAANQDSTASTFAASTLVQRAGDERNELGTFKPVNQNKLLKNLVQRAGNFSAAIKLFLSRASEDVSKEQAVLEHFNTFFHGHAVRSIQKLFRYREGTSNFYRGEDPMQYIPQRKKVTVATPKGKKDVWVLEPVAYTDAEGKPLLNSKGQPIVSSLDPVITAAIAASAYEWLGNEATRKALGQTDASLRTMLDLDKDEFISEEIWNHLGETGISTESLAKELGRTILERLSITDTLESDALAKSRLELSLGYMAIAVMEDMGYVDRQEIFLGKLSDTEKARRAIEAAVAIEAGKTPPTYELNDGQFGLEGLQAGIHLTTEKVHYAPVIDDEGVDTNSREGTPTVKITMLKSTRDPESKHKLLAEQRVVEIKELLGLVPETFDSIFGNESPEKSIIWGNPKQNGDMMIGRTGEKAHKQQASNLKKYSKTRWNRSTATMDLFEAMLALDPDAKGILGEILGRESNTDKLKLREKSIAGINRSIERDVAAVKEWLAQAKLREEDTSFTIASTFMNNMRMLQRGLINPQNSKIHRNLFAPEGWTTSFTIKDNPELVESFKESIAVAFDIESGKTGGYKKQLDKLNILFKNPEKLTIDKFPKHYAIVEAIKVLRQYDKGTTLTPEMMQIIAAGVKATGTKAHGLKGLIEWARFENYRSNNNPNKGAFTTDMYNEIDGVSNGVIISLLQFIPNSGSKQALLAMLAMGGMSVNRKKVNLDKLLSQDNLNDAYQRMGQILARELGFLKQELESKGLDKEFGWAKAVGGILGQFQDKDGVIEKFVRNLSKPRTMQTQYGAGIYRQSQLLTGGDVINDGIYKKIEDFIANPGKTRSHTQTRIEFEQLLGHVNTLTWSDKRGAPNKQDNIKNYLGKDGQLDKEKMAKYKLWPWQIKRIETAVGATYGLAMERAINEIYAPLLAARKPLNDTVQLAVTVYNAVLATKVQALIELKKAQNTDNTKTNFTLTKMELNTILAEIEHLAPKIRTPMKGEASFLGLATRGKTKQYNQEQRVEQIYNSKTRPRNSGNAEGIPYLDPPGVSALVKAIQMIDSMVANGLMGTDIPFLNNHDGFSHGLGDSRAVANQVNTSFMELAKYDLGQAFADMNAELTKTGQQALLDTGVSHDTLFDSLVKDGVITTEIAAQITSPDDTTAKSRLAALTKKINALVNDKENYISKRAATEQVVTALLKGWDRAELVKNTFTAIEANAKDMAAQVTTNKKIVTDAITHSGQYPFRGEGVDVTPITNEATIFPEKVKVDNVTTIDGRLTDQIIGTVKELVGTAYASNQDSIVSTDELDYQYGAKVDALNVRQVFEEIVALDIQAQHSSVQDSPAHVAHLTRVLDSIVAKVMTPVQLFRGQHQIDAETQGLYTVNAKTGSKIWLQTQQLSTQPKPGMLGQGIRMSAAEVYAHELVHHITLAGLKGTSRLRNQAYALYEAAYKAFTDRYGANAFLVFMNDPYADLNDSANAHEIQAAQARWKYVFEAARKKDGSHKGIEEFVAFGMTNDNFKGQLASLVLAEKVRKPLAGIFEKNVQTTLLNLFDRIMDFVSKTFYHQQSSRRADQELENLVRALGESESRGKTAVMSALIKAENYLTAQSIKLDEKIKSGVTNQFAKGRAAEKLDELEKIQKDMKARGLTPSQLTADEQQKIKDLGDEIDVLLAQDDKSIVGRMGSIIVASQRLPEMDNMLGYKIRQLLNYYNDKQEGLIPAIITEMQGTTHRLKPLHALINRRNRVIDHARQEVTNNTREMLNTWFQDVEGNAKDWQPGDKTAITKAMLKTDLTSLVQRSSERALIGYVTDNQQREAKIQSLLQEISNDPRLAKHRAFFEKAADDLGYYMITSETRHDGVPLMNAHNIVMMPNSKYQGRLQNEDFWKAEGIIDQLATLYALGYVQNAQKQTLGKLLTEHWEAMKKVMLHHKLIKEQALRDTFGGSPALMQKGYTMQILDARMNYEQGTKDDEIRYAKMGYIMEKTPIKRDPKDPVQDDIYMFKSNTGTVNDYQEGIMSNDRNTARGKTQYHLQQQLGNTTNPSQIAQVHNHQMLAVLNRKIAAMHSNTPRPPYTRTGAQNFMIPKLNDKGQIVEMRYMMSEHTKDTVLQQFSEFDVVLGAMAGQIVTKKHTPEINGELVTALKDLFDAEYNKYPDAYVEISPTSDNQRYRDIYHRLPHKTKIQIEGVWGSNKMMVSQDVINLAFGQRKYSITELFGKDAKSRTLFERIMVDGLIFALGFDHTRTDPHASQELLQAQRQGRAVVRSKRVEETMMQLTQLAKSNIVVRNLKIIYGNHMSNTALLKSRGVPLERIMTLTREATLSAHEYQKDWRALNLLRSNWLVIEEDPQLARVDKDRRLQQMDRQIRQLEDRLARNPSTPLMAAGLMPRIVDDVDTGHVQSPHIYGVDALLEKVLTALPKTAEKVARTLFMTTDTEGYKTLNNAVTMTDYIGRYVYYHHLTAQGMSHKDAVSEAMDQFINFGLPTHLTLDYLNRTGLVWFSKYQLSVLKHIKNLITERPFTTLVTFILGSFIGGNNILQSIPGITKDALQNMGDPFSAIAETPWGIFNVDLTHTIASAVVE